MGLCLSLTDANWVLNALQPFGPTSTLDRERKLEIMQNLLRAALSSSLRRENKTSRAIAGLMEKIEENETDVVIRSLRQILQGQSWMALIIPGGPPSLDRFLCTSDIIMDLALEPRAESGLLLQCLGAPNARLLEVSNVSPALRLALVNATRWPGVLVCTPSGDVAFLELPTTVTAARVAMRWLITSLRTSAGSLDLTMLRRDYRRHVMPEPDGPLPLRLLHISDLHLGSRVAQRRLPLAKEAIRQVDAELGRHAPTLPVVTGDLVSSPGSSDTAVARGFLEFLRCVGTEEPVIVWGNHDVRRHGLPLRRVDPALSVDSRKVRWIDCSRVGLVCFNSAREGNLGRGRIGEQQLLELANALEEEPAKAEQYLMVALLHHHPIPIERTPWYVGDWFSRFFPVAFEKTMELEDAQEYLEWLTLRRVRVTLHGHRHIPRADEKLGSLFVGCGSTVGKVKFREPDKPFVSLNVVTLDVARGRVSARLVFRRVSGNGLTAHEQHEAVFTKRTPS